MCEPTAIATAASGIASAVGTQAAAEQATSAKNRAKLKNHERNNQQYLTDVMLNNAIWKNDVQIADVQFDQTYTSMIDQWVQQDKQLDKIFSAGHYKIEKSIRKMYENDYAGTMTGNTAARLASKSVKDMGFETAETLHGLMFDEEEAMLKQDITKGEADRKQWDIYDKIRFQPIHGHAPPPPIMEAPPSRAGMFLQMGASVVGGMATAGVFKAPTVYSGAGASQGVTQAGASVFSGTTPTQMSGFVPKTITPYSGLA